MHRSSGLLAQYDGFGAVMRCNHGCVHIQYGATTLTLSEAQYLRFVALLAESAANYELLRQPPLVAEDAVAEGASADPAGSEVD